jgi:hypothetical protein
MADFELDIQKFCDEAQGKIDQFVRGFALRMTAEIKQHTPVLTGRLRASIQPTQNLAEWQSGEPIVIGTNVEYARRIEYGFVGRDSLGRLYNQPGAHMFAMAIARAPEIADEVLHDIQNGPTEAGTIAKGIVIGAAEGAAEGALFGGAGALPGAVIGGVIGGVEAAIEGPGGNVPIGGAAGALEGLIIGGPFGAAGNVIVGAVEGAGEAELLKPDGENLDE